MTCSQQREFLDFRFPMQNDQRSTPTPGNSLIGTYSPSFFQLVAHFDSHQQAHPVLHTYSSHSSDGIYLDEEESHQAFRRFREDILKLPEAELLKVLTTVQKDVCLQSGELPEMYWISGVIKKKKNHIASGSEARVHRAKYHGDSVVVRVFHYNESWGPDEREFRLKLVLREIISHWQLRHPNVVALIGIYRSVDNSCSEEDDSDDSNAADTPDPVQLPNMVLQYAKYLSAQEYLKSDAGCGSFLNV
ncbi:hypothetical protein DL93DRAFT_2103823, partial [Clavulina sp. PMI_390]